MAQLLMIESFIGGNAMILPKLLKELGHCYTFVTRSKDIYKRPYGEKPHPVIAFADEILETNTNNKTDILDSLTGKDFDGVITTCDYYIDMVSDIATTLGLPCPFPKEVKNVRYKHKLRQLMKAHQLANPEFALAFQWEDLVSNTERIGYPIVLKPVDLASSAYVRLIRNEAELKDAYDQLKAFPINWRDQKRDSTYLIEDYMKGNEVSVEAITYKGVTRIIGITQKKIMGAPYFIEDGHMFPADLTSDMERQIEAYVIQVLKAVDYDNGVSHTEVKLTKDGPKIVEINPRCAGGHIVEIIELVSGVNMLKAFVELSIGVKPEITEGETGIASACIKFLTPTVGGKVLAIEGLDSLSLDHHIVSYEINDCVGKTLGAPIDNTARIGRVITKDIEGLSAMKYANEALGRINITFG